LFHVKRINSPRKSDSDGERDGENKELEKDQVFAKYRYISLPVSCKTKKYPRHIFALVTLFDTTKDNLIGF
jgi:hypothetical protein